MYKNYTRIQKYTKNIRYFFNIRKNIRENLVKYTYLHDLRKICLDYISNSATGHSWGFTRAKVVNTQRNTYKRKAEPLFIKNHLSVDAWAT